MAKIGRNDPCPCGSGKKYKHCCMDNNIIPFPIDQEQGEESNHWDDDDLSLTFMERMGTPNKATELIKEIEKDLEGRVFDSLEDLNAHYNKELNEREIDDFLGLSPKQMHKILWTTFEDNSDLVEFIPKVNPEEVEKSPFLSQALHFLELLKEIEPLKATQKGNLPTKIVQDLYEAKYKKYAEFRYQVRKEDDFPSITYHRYIYKMAGLIKKNKNQFSLTKKGRSILDKKEYTLLYKSLFNTFLSKFNWAYSDGYPEYQIIQQSALFNLFILKQKAKEYIDSNDLGEVFLTNYHQKNPEKNVISCFSLRFLERFCLPLGLVSEKKEGERFVNETRYYKITPWFERFFKWKI
jgi:hypothetical protein